MPNSNKFLQVPIVVDKCIINSYSAVRSFLSSLKGVGSSPLIYFSAALLGYTSKGNSGQCTRTFPNCPSDPDKLVKYLNQHNGGFFSGFNPSIDLKSQTFRRAKETSYSYVPFGKKHLNAAKVEKRIQTRPTLYIPLSSDSKDEANVFDFDDPRRYRHPKGLQFPLSEPTESLKFPEGYEDYEDSHADSYRRPKELQYDLSYNQNSLSLQRPLPNHRPSMMIFPIRTGTGELKLDPDELEIQNEPTYFDEYKDNTRIKFQLEQEDRPFSENNGNYRNGNSIFTFPS
nr:unnamed protein product [Callosobruchus analis]